jgi:hypothetical protein
MSLPWEGSSADEELGSHNEGALPTAVQQGERWCGRTKRRSVHQ